MFPIKNGLEVHGESKGVELFIHLHSFRFFHVSLLRFFCVRENVSHLGHILKQLHNNNTDTAIHIKRPLLSLAGSIQLLLS